MLMLLIVGWLLVSKSPGVEVGTIRRCSIEVSLFKTSSGCYSAWTTRMGSRMLMLVLVSVLSAIIGLGGTSRCDSIDVFGLMTTCVDDNSTTTGCIGYAVTRRAEVEDLQNVLAWGSCGKES